MKNKHLDIDFKAVTRRIAMEMKGYSPSAWAEKVGVTINVVSNIHSAKAKQNPSLSYILAVAVATGKPMEYLLWGGPLYRLSNPSPMEIRKSQHDYSQNPAGDSAQDPEMGIRVQYWRKDMGLSILEVSQRSGLPVDLITKIEHGYHTTTDAIVKLANALRCSTDYILGCGGNSVSEPPKFKS